MMLLAASWPIPIEFALAIRDTEPCGAEIPLGGRP
jgi:hypothetical protein